MSLVQRAKSAPVIRTVVAVQQRYGDDRAGIFAGAITLHAFLSIFPLALLGLSVIGFIVDSAEQRSAWADTLSEAVPGLRPIVGDTFESLARDRAATGLIGLAGLVWTGTGVVRVAGLSLSTIFRTHVNKGVRVHAWALGSLVALGALAVVSLALGGLTRGLNGPILSAVAFVSMFAVDAALFLLAYRILTQRDGPAFGDLWAGALFAAVGWTVLKVVGFWYATRTVGQAEAVYGAFAAAVGLVVMLSLAARIFLYGAELNAVLLKPERDEAVEHPAFPQRMAG